LLSAFIACPAPSGPQWKIFLPIFSSTGCTCFSTDASPPTMMASVASFAPTTEPDTGASSSSTCFLRSSFSSSRVEPGSAELMSITTAPACRPGRAASTALRTAAPSGSMVIRMCAPSAASLADLRLPLPFRS